MTFDLGNPEPWMDQAACLDEDPETFFPAPGQSSLARRAKEICAVCPVKVKCLAYAVDHQEEHGIWGGESPRQRNKAARLKNDRPAPQVGQDCGTWKGAKRHYTNKETLCIKCRIFVRDETRTRRNTVLVEKDRSEPMIRSTCGTETGATMHYRNKEKPCPECSRASNEGRKRRFLNTPRSKQLR